MRIGMMAPQTVFLKIVASQAQVWLTEDVSGG